MATSQAGSGTAAAVRGTANAIGETIVGSHVLKIDGVGKSIKSSTFSVGGHSWYMECYPCGDVEDSAGWVTLFLCLHRPCHKAKVEAACMFTLMDYDGSPPAAEKTTKHTYDADTLWRDGVVIVEREDLENNYILKDDCLQIRCDVYIVKEFPAVLPPNLHRPLTLRDLSGVHRELPSTAAGISAENVAWSHVLTIERYSKAKKALRPGESFESELFVAGGYNWYLDLYPNGEKHEDNCLAIFLVSNGIGEAGVKVRFELTLLTVAREPEFSLLQDSLIHVKCDMTIVKEITPMRPSDQLHRHFGDLLASQVGTDVTFEVSGDLFSAHKCVLATRSTAFMAEFFGPRNGSNITTTVTRVVIDDMEPRVFKALLHFIYTDTLPEVHEDVDKIVVAQGLIVAADRYAMERLKLICADMLCNYVNDARTAVASLELAIKHGCRRLSEKCLELLKGHLAKVVP